MLRETRREEDFLENTNSLICLDPKAQRRRIADNFNAHASESLVRHFARQCGTDIDLGLKGYRSVMRSVKTRQSFLSDKSHHTQFVYNPKHCR